MNWLGEINLKCDGVAGCAVAFVWCGVLPVIGALWLIGWLK